MDQLGTSSNYYFLRSEGYGNPRSEGDAYDPYNQQHNHHLRGTSVTTNPAGTRATPLTCTRSATTSSTDVTDGRR